MGWTQYAERADGVSGQIKSGKTVVSQNFSRHPTSQLAVITVIINEVIRQSNSECLLRTQFLVGTRNSPSSISSKMVCLSTHCCRHAKNQMTLYIRGRLHHSPRLLAYTSKRKTNDTAMLVWWKRQKDQQTKKKSNFSARKWNWALSFVWGIYSSF